MIFSDDVQIPSCNYKHTWHVLRRWKEARVGFKTFLHTTPVYHMTEERCTMCGLLRDVRGELVK